MHFISRIQILLQVILSHKLTHSPTACPVGIAVLCLWRLHYGNISPVVVAFVVGRRRQRSMHAA